MSRPKALVPNDHLHIRIEPGLKARLDLMLYSEVEKRIPKGAHKAFIEARIREWLEWVSQPLDIFGFPPGYYITGPTAMVEAVSQRLEYTKDSL